VEVNEVSELKQRLIDVWDGLGQSVIDNSIGVMQTSLCVCLCQRRTFSAFKEISEHMYTKLAMKY